MMLTGESQINGNGITPPATPKKTPIKTLYSKPSGIIFTSPHNK